MNFQWALLKGEHLIEAYQITLFYQIQSLDFLFTQTSDSSFLTLWVDALLVTCELSAFSFIFWLYFKLSIIFITVLIRSNPFYYYFE